MMSPANSPNRPDTADYRRIFLEDIPLCDVRAPVEFMRGSVPGAVNHPLMQDAEREQVGITYKQEGQDAAITKGHELVAGVTKVERVAAWRRFADENPGGYIFCFRGGLRSQISQRWMQEAGCPFPLVKGGYKAMRRFLIEETERLVDALNYIVVAGPTGAGKTDFLLGLPNTLDLEGAANHRGSSFGRRLGDQPSQINFENALSVRLMKLEASGQRTVFLEDEGQRIGGLEIPLPLWRRMQGLPAISIKEPFEARLERVHRDYVEHLSTDYSAAFGEEGHARYAAFMQEALMRIRKRLGGVRYGEVQTLLLGALSEQERTGNTALHRDWISHLLRDYYDPMYEYQQSRSERQILFTGSLAEATAWAEATEVGSG